MNIGNHWVAMGLLMSLMGSRSALAHCDTMDGPLIVDAKQALEKKDVTAVLKWVGPGEEQRIGDAFKKAAADLTQQRSFFELLVKVHRQGEGAEYTGVKPAGSSVEPGIKEADQAIESGEVGAVIELLQRSVKAGVSQRLRQVLETKKHKDHNVAAGRKFVAAYVDYVHYVENIAKPYSKNDQPKHQH